MRIANRLAGSVGQHRFNMWFERSAKLSFEGNDRRLRVAVPNQFVLDWIERNFQDELQQSALAEVGDDVVVDVHIDESQFTTSFAHLPNSDGAFNAATKNAAALTASSSDSNPALGTQNGKRSINSPRGASNYSAPRRPSLRYRFEDFIVGSSNELALNAAIQLIEDEHAAVNPLFIHGGVGLGKTHLLQAICTKIREKQPDARVLYTTGEKFTNEFLTAMRDRKLDTFRRRIRHLDLLAIDDVHFLAGKEKSQQEFLHSFDEIDLSGARVVMASDNHPKQIKKFDLALVSRCMRGLVAEVTPPDTAMRIQILTALAQRRGLTLYETVAAALAKQCHGSIREMEGVLAKLDALSRLPKTNYSGGNTGLTNAAFSNGDNSSPENSTDDAAETNSTTNGGNDAERMPPRAHKHTTSRNIGHALVNKLFETENLRPRKPISFEAILNRVSETLQVPKTEILSTKRVKHIVLARSITIYLARKLTSMSYPEITDALNRSSHSTVIAADQRIKIQLENTAPVSLPAMLESMPLAELVDQLKRKILAGG